jgi:hypothetical protein
LNFSTGKSIVIKPSAATRTGGCVNNVVRLLNDLHFLALHNLTDIHLGSELLFWFHYTQALKRLIFKDQYIPSSKYRELKATSNFQNQA